VDVARIEASWPETTGAVGVRLSSGWISGETRPGQYVLAGEKKMPLVLASGPGEPPMLLVGANAQASLTLDVGSSLMIDGPLGGGFPLEAARGHEVVIFAVGTALAAARALIQTIAAHRADYERVRAYLGAHTTEAHAYRSEDARWADARIEVVRATSRPWIQDLFLAGDPPSAGTRAFAAGHSAMMISVRAALGERGMDPATLGTNA